MILAVTGGRDFIDSVMVDRNLCKWLVPMDRQSVIIEGGARGLDSLVKFWGLAHGIHVAEVRADWSSYKRAAGVYRNEAMMLLRPEILLAFPGGNGTRNAVETAKRLDIPVRYAE